MDEAGWEGGWQEEREWEAILSCLDPKIEIGHLKFFFVGLQGVRVGDMGLIVNFLPVDSLCAMEFQVEMHVWPICLAIHMNGAFHKVASHIKPLWDCYVDVNSWIFVLGWAHYDMIIKLEQIIRLSLLNPANLNATYEEF